MSDANINADNRSLLLSELVYETFNQNEMIHKYIHAFECVASRRIELEEIRMAFKIMMEFQTVLKMQIVKKNCLDYTFKILNDAELNDHVPVEEEETNDFDESWVRLAEREGSTKGFDKIKGLLWKVIFMRIDKCNNFGLLCVFHHGISDARSVFDAIYRQFLPILSYVINNENVPLEFTEKALPLCPTPEEIMFEGRERAIKLVQRPSFLMRQLCNFLEWLTSRMTLEDKKKVTYLSDLNGSVHWESNNYVEFVPYDFSQILTEALKTKCKMHHVTVHAALLTAAAKALVIIANESNAQSPPRRINLTWQVCTRSISGLHYPQPLGVMVASGAGNLTVTNTLQMNVNDFWKDATHVAEQCRKSMPKETYSFSEKTMNAFLGAVIHNALQRGVSMFSIMGKAVGIANIIISNLGLCEKNGPPPSMCNASDTVKLEKQYFGINGSIDMHGGGSVFSCVSTFQDRLRWNLCISKRWISRERALLFVGKIETILRQACSCED